MLRKDLTDLPAASKPTGLAPDEDDTFVRVLVDELAKRPPKPKAGDTLSRHSAAGSCMMQVALLRDGVEPEPMDMAGLHVTNIGTLLHEAWQDALYTALGGKVDFEAPTVIEDLTSGSCDAVTYDDNDQPDHVYELKTCAATQYEYMIGMKGAPQGPKFDHKVQLALNVQGHGAPAGTLIYLARSSVSKGKSERANLSESLRLGAQWSFPWEAEGCDHADGCRCLKPLADDWLAALRFVRDNPTSEVPRWVMGEMPKGARLNPASGMWTLQRDDDVLDSGSYWSKGTGCVHYCPVRDACVAQWEGGA